MIDTGDGNRDSLIPRLRENTHPQIIGFKVNLVVEDLVSLEPTITLYLNKPNCKLLAVDFWRIEN
jgi:hypothetical protein